MNTLFCKPARIVDGLTDSTSVLQEIAKTASGMENVDSDDKDLLRRLKDREKIASTAIGHGVAIPHCLVEGMTSIAAGLVVARSPVAFNAPDGNTVDLFFFIVSPAEARTPHLQVLSAISRAVRDEGFREALRRAATGEELSALIEQRITLPEQNLHERPCRFRVHIQNPDLIQDVIEDLSAFGIGSMVVHECENASSYLGNVPLFAGLWSTRDDTSIRVIEGVVPHNQANELVRRVSDRTDHKPGVLVMVDELLVAYGSLEL